MYGISVCAFTYVGGGGLFSFFREGSCVMAHYDMPVFAMASSAGSFSVVTGADASALQNVCKELSVFAEVTVEKEVEVICVQEADECKGKMSEKKSGDFAKGYSFADGVF